MIQQRTSKTINPGYFTAISLTTALIALHGSAHDAQKNRTDTRLRSEDRSVWNCAEEVTSVRFAPGVWTSVDIVVVVGLA